MSDKFVKVATYHRSFEAQLAKNLLETEDIKAMLSGDVTADVLPFGQAGGGDQIVLQVREEDAQRATGLLAAVAAAKLDEDWEEQTESDVWVCSLCGEPISNRLSVCHSCQTPRDSIRADSPRGSDAIQRPPTSLSTSDKIQPPAEITDTPALALQTPPPPVHPEDEETTAAPMTECDALARRAFVASTIAMVAWFILPLAWYYVLLAMFAEDEMSPRGRRYLYTAQILSVVFVIIVLAFCAGGLIYL